MFNGRREFVSHSIAALAGCMGAMVSNAFGFWGNVKKVKPRLVVIDCFDGTAPYHRVESAMKLSRYEVLSLPCFPALNERWPDWLDGGRVSAKVAKQVAPGVWEVRLEVEPTQGGEACLS